MSESITVDKQILKSDYGYSRYYPWMISFIFGLAALLQIFLGLVMNLNLLFIMGGGTFVLGVFLLIPAVGKKYVILYEDKITLFPTDHSFKPRNFSFKEFESVSLIKIVAVRIMKIKIKSRILPIEINEVAVKTPKAFDSILKHFSKKGLIDL